MAAKSAILLAVMVLTATGLARMDPGVKADSRGRGSGHQDDVDTQQLLRPGSLLFCEGCYATVSSLIEKLQRQQGPIRWDNMEKHLCRLDVLNTFVYSPPKIRKVCSAIFEAHQKPLKYCVEKSLSQGPNVDMKALVEEVCVNHLEACPSYDAVPSVARDLRWEEQRRSDPPSGPKGRSGNRGEPKSVNKVATVELKDEL